MNPADSSGENNGQNPANWLLLVSCLLSITISVYDFKIYNVC